MKPRQHHMQMKYVLGKLASQHTANFFEKLASSREEAFIKIWDAIGEALPVEERVSSSGLTVWHQAADKCLEILVFVFPNPVSRNEAYFVGIVRIEPDHCRVFCLEQSADVTSGQECTVVSELASFGRANWGFGPKPQVEDFAEFISKISTDPAASPLSAVNLQLW